MNNINENTIEPFLFKISKNLFINNYKKNRISLKFINTQCEKIELNSPEYLMEYKEYNERLQKAISNLPKTCRTYFLLNRMDEMKYKDIANNFGVSVKSVEKQMTKAMALLKKELNKNL